MCEQAIAASRGISLARALLLMLKEQLPGCTVIGITHQAALAGLFDRTFVLDRLAEPA